MKNLHGRNIKKCYLNPNGLEGITEINKLLGRIVALEKVATLWDQNARSFRNAKMF